MGAGRHRAVSRSCRMRWREWLLRTLVGARILARPDLVGRMSATHPTPEELPPGRLVVVRDGGIEKLACLRCPGGCGAKILLSMSPKRWPRWQVSLDWLSRPTAAPSVRQLNACHCHFWIRGGQVEWCADSPTGPMATAAARLRLTRSGRSAHRRPNQGGRHRQRPQRGHGGAQCRDPATINRPP